MEVKARAVVGILVALAISGYGWIYLDDAADQPPSQARIEAGYAAAAAKMAEQTRAQPSPASVSSSHDDTPDVAVTKDYECGAAEGGLHPGWSTDSIALYCRRHHDVPERSASRTKIPADSLRGCIAAWMQIDPGASRDYAEATCKIARSTP